MNKSASAGIQKSQQHNQLLPDLADAITDLILILDREFRILYANAAALARLGYALDEMREKSILNFIQSSAHKKSIRLFSSSLSGGTRESMLPLAAKNGSLVMVKTNLVHTRWHGGAAIAAISREFAAEDWQKQHVNPESEQAAQTRPRLVFWTADAGMTRILHLSDGFEEVTGIPAKKALADPGLLLPLFPDDFLRKLQNGPLTGNMDAQCDITRPDGTLRRVRLCAMPVNGPDGRISRIAGCLIDSTPLMNMRDELLRADKRLNSLLDSINLGFIITSGDKIIDANNAMIKMLGYSSKAEFLLEKTRCFFTDPEQAKRIISIMEARSTISFTELRLRTRDGGIIWVELSSSPQLLSGSWPDTYYYSFVEDITRRKEAEMALRDSERYKRSILRGISDAYAVIEPVFDAKGEPADFRILEVNQALEKTVEIPANQLIARTSADILGQPYELWKNYAHRVVSGERFTVEVTLPFTGKFVRISVFPAENGAYAIFMTDLTAHRDAQTKLTQARDNLRSLTAHLQTVREEERTRTASEMHEELSAAMTSFHMELDALKEMGVRNMSAGDAREFSAKADDINERAVKYLEHIHELGTRLRPLVLDDLGIADAIRWHLQKVSEQSGIGCTFDSGVSTLPRKLSTALFRMLEEAVRCAVQYNRSKDIAVKLSRGKKTVLLHIECDRSLPIPRSAQGKRKLVLLAIKEQAISLGGDAEIVRTRGRSNMNIHLPLSAPKIAGTPHAGA
jgi:PAS domain S-box-containing protein